MKLLSGFAKDFRLTFRSYYIYLELFMALFFVAVTLFVVPENVAMEAKLYVHAGIELPGDAGAAGFLPTRDIGVERVASAEELRERVSADRSSMGLDLDLAGGKPRLTFIFQGFEGERLKNALRASLSAAAHGAAVPPASAVPVRTLSSRRVRLSDRMSAVPVFLTMNAAFMGLFVVAAYVFLDKDEGTIKAIAVTPARMWHYLAGKGIVVLVTGFMSCLLTVLPIAGAGADYLLLAPLLAGTNFFGTALGLLIASFFDDLSSAMGWLYGGVIMLGAASVSYYMPSFSPLWIRALPSYPMLFAYREIFLPSPDAPFVLTVAAASLAAGVLLFLLAGRQFKRRLTP